MIFVILEMCGVSMFAHIFFMSLVTVIKHFIVKARLLYDFTVKDVEKQ